jgi:glutamate synthase domain-containing protein 2
MRTKFFSAFVTAQILLLVLAKFVHQGFYILFFLTIPLLLLAIAETMQTTHTIIKNYPLFGRMRYWMEALRPKIYQYFVESDTDGTPINRIFRSVVYQRAKNTIDTRPFGTQLDLYETGYEWINHSITPLEYDEVKHESLRINVGSNHCKKPYSLSILNISAMSYGSLSANAVEALNHGAAKEHFAHNTGEGGISPFHLKHGGDLIWQIGTGYFGCRDESGNFSPELFKKNASQESVKMIEIKLSQGAKPGHGGILPASKNTEEIAKIRAVKPHTDVISPPKHKAFNDAESMINFIQRLRDLSDGKPIGIKLCVGHPEEVEALIQTMAANQNYPDFISVDGGEGGTGAAPLEFTNSIGMSLKDGIAIVDNLLRQYGIRDQIKIIASGKIITGFHIIKSIAMGADACYSARAMMLALGCIQALECNRNICPAGIATQNKELMRGLHVGDKSRRVANFHRNTVEAVAEILAACNLQSTELLERKHIWRRLNPVDIANYESLYPYPVEVKKAS